MERPIFKSSGTPVEQLDTPALVVDLDVLQQNINTVHSFFIDLQVKLRPHVEGHLCPAIAHKQLAAGGTNGGLSVMTVGQAESFVKTGFGDIFVANEIVTRPKIRRLCSLAHQSKITVAVDSPKNIADLSEAAQADGVVLNIVVDIHTRIDRCGVEPGKPSLDLARSIKKAAGLHFAGLMSYEGTIIEQDFNVLASESKKSIQQVLDTRELIEREGLDVEVVSVGGTHNYEIAGRMSGVTEIPAGSYALMDSKYAASRTGLQPAAKIMSTVTSRPETGTAILDAGRKATGEDLGLPTLGQLPDVTLVYLSAEHAKLSWESSALADQLNLGDKVWFTPWDIGSCVNMYDYIMAIRKGKLETALELTARGLYR